MPGDRGPYDEAVGRFQQTAFWNLRTRIANVSIVIGGLALMMIAVGSADGARFVPTVICAVAGVFGAGVYLSRPYPSLAKWFLVLSVVLTLGGVIGLLVAVSAGA